MPKFFKNKFFSVAATGILILTPLAFLTASASAAETGQGGGVISSITNLAIIKSFGAIAYVLGFIASLVFGIAGVLVDFAMAVNTQILSDSNAIVQTGWSIVRNLANLGFILFIIAIAFATIFRMQSYGMKKTLWRLIVAALLVNFSLVVAGAFINFSDLISQFFLDRVTSNGVTGFSEALGGAIGSQALLKVKEMSGLTGVVRGGAAGLLTVGASSLFVAGFTLIGGLTLLAVAAMFLIRYVMLSMLLIMSPAALLMWILPGTQKHWQKWWSEFIKWVIFAPIVLFYLYLTVATLQGTQRFTLSSLANKNSAAAVNNSVTFGIEVIGNLAVILGLMMGGLIFASKQSGTGGKMFYGWAQASGDWAKARGKRFGRDITDRARNVGRKTDTSGETTTWLQRRGAGLAGVKLLNKIPGVRGTTQGLGAVIAKQGVVKPRGEEVEKYRKDNLEALTKDALKVLAENPTTFTDPIKAAAVAKQAAKKGVNLSDEVWQKHLANAERLGNTGDIYSARPDLAGTRINAKHRKDAEDDLKKQNLPVTAEAIESLAKNKAIEGAVKGIKIENITNLRSSVIEYDPKSDDVKKNKLTEDKIRIVLNLSSGHLAKLGSSDDTAGQRENIERILQELENNKNNIPEHLRNNFDKLKKFVNKSPNYQSLGERSSGKAEEDEDLEFQ